MSSPAVKPIPDGMHSLSPHLICSGALEAIDFYKAAFDAVELMRLLGQSGTLVHATLRVGDSIFMLAEENPKWGALGPKTLNGSPVSIHMMVENVDAMVAKAVAAGAKVTMPVTDMFWGDRYGQIEDPFGHRWSIATHVRDLTPDEIKRAMPGSM